MADDGERPDEQANLQHEDTLPEPVDLNARRERKQATNAPVDPYQQAYEDLSDELERQAREMVRVFRENVGDLGERVRQAVEHAGTLWNQAAEAAPAPVSADPHPLELRARALMRRWVKRDFLVDPDLPVAMSFIGLQDAEIWRVELRERGESRSLADSTEPYTGAQPPAPSPVLPVWDYTFPSTPDIEAGERREPVAGSAMRGACERCHGSGHRACAHCEGKGMAPCPECRGRGAKVCPRCRGRGRIADPAAERQARAAKTYFQVHAERFAQNAVERLADFSERLRQDYGAPLPPSGDWAPLAPASGRTIACPDCVNGSLPCVCNNGKVACPVCHGTSYETCPACAGSGQVLRQRQVVRRFDTRIRTRDVTPDESEPANWAPEQMTRRSSAAEPVWEGDESELSGPAPSGVPEHVWQVALDLKQTGEGQAAPATTPAEVATDAGERHVLSRRVALARTPMTHVEYAFAGRDYAVVAIGRADDERFVANAFPPRWNRLSRFFQAVARDLAGETTRDTRSGPLAHSGATRDRSHIRIIEEPADLPDAPEAPDVVDATPDASPDAAADVAVDAAPRHEAPTEEL